MNKREIELAAQRAVEEAEAGMTAIEEAIEEHIDAVMNVIGPAETVHWLRTIITQIEHLSECEGEA